VAVGIFVALIADSWRSAVSSVDVRELVQACQNATGPRSIYKYNSRPHFF